MGAETQNAVVSILRGTAGDGYGDVADDRQVLTAGIPATLAETVQTVFDPGAQAPRIIRSSTCLVPAWTGVLASDQIQDQATGDVYAVEDVEIPPTITGAPVDTKLTLRRVSAGAP